MSEKILNEPAQSGQGGQGGQVVVCAEVVVGVTVLSAKHTNAL